MSFLHYLFGFEGRLRRSSYFGAAVLVHLTPHLVLGGLWQEQRQGGLPAFVAPWAPPISLLLLVLVSWSSLALAAKRWHDAGLTGWLGVFGLIPGAGLVMFLIQCLVPGQRGDNRYGRDPRRNAAAAA